MTMMTASGQQNPHQCSCIRNEKNFVGFVSDNVMNLKPYRTENCT